MNILKSFAQVQRILEKKLKFKFIKLVDYSSEDKILEIKARSDKAYPFLENKTELISSLIDKVNLKCISILTFEDDETLDTIILKIKSKN